MFRVLYLADTLKLVIDALKKGSLSKVTMMYKAILYILLSFGDDVNIVNKQLLKFDRFVV